MTSDSDTKYGDQLPEGGAESLYEDDTDDAPDRTRVSGHEIEVTYTTDPGETGGYGRERYDATIRYDDETGEPYVLFVVEYRWKGNYWRDTTDWDWQDVPEPVREQVAAVLPVDGPDALESGVRLMDEGGESRWKKHHKPRVESTSAGEMWGTSSLRESLERASAAAESFEDGSEAEGRAESIVDDLRETIEAVQEDDST